jgi:hypothetical protein
MTARPKAWACTCSLAEITGSNLTVGMDICPQVQMLSTDKRVLPSVACLSVIVKRRKRGGPAPLANVVPRKKEKQNFLMFLVILQSIIL